MFKDRLDIAYRNFRAYQKVLTPNNSSSTIYALRICDTDVTLISIFEQIAKRVPVKLEIPKYPTIIMINNKNLWQSMDIKR